MPYRIIMVDCPACTERKIPPTPPGSEPICDKCGGTGKVREQYHYRGSARLSPEDAATLDEFMTSVARRFGQKKTDDIKESQ